MVRGSVMTAAQTSPSSPESALADFSVPGSLGPHLLISTRKTSSCLSFTFGCCLGSWSLRSSHVGSPGGDHHSESFRASLLRKANSGLGAGCSAEKCGVHRVCCEWLGLGERLINSAPDSDTCECCSLKRSPNRLHVRPLFVNAPLRHTGWAAGDWMFLSSCFLLAEQLLGREC